MRVFLQNPPPINIGGRFAQSEYQFTLQSPDIDTLYASSRELQRRLMALPQLTQVTSDLKLGNPQVLVDIDRERAAALGVTRGPDRVGALRRVRLPAGVHHLHPGQRVLGGDGAASPSTSGT